MPRKTSEYDLYHVVIRGIGRCPIFTCDDERSHFLELLAEELKREDGELYAWRLMTNHVHLLLHMPLERVSCLMRATTSRYARMYNSAHDRSGHLLESRFRSEAIDSETYLKTAVRYIHQNPVKPGLSADCEYKWSSYNSYLHGSRVTCTAPVLDVFGGIGEFVRFHEDFAHSETCLDVDNGWRLTEEEAYEIACSQVGREVLDGLASAEAEERGSVLRMLSDEGIGVRQLERMTGIPKSTIARVVRRQDDGKRTQRRDETSGD